MKLIIGVGMIVANYLFLDATAYAQDASADANKAGLSAGASTVGVQKAESQQADNLTKRKILKDMRANSSISDETKKSLDVKIAGNTIYLDGPVNTIEEKATILRIVTKQGPRYKINDTTVIK